MQITPDEFNIIMAALRDTASDYMGMAQEAKKKNDHVLAQSTTNIHVFCHNVINHLESGARQLNPLQAQIVSYALKSAGIKYTQRGDDAMIKSEMVEAERSHNFAFWCGKTREKIIALVGDRPGLLLPLA